MGLERSAVLTPKAATCKPEATVRIRTFADNWIAVASVEQKCDCRNYDDNIARVFPQDKGVPTRRQDAINADTIKQLNTLGLRLTVVSRGT